MNGNCEKFYVAKVVKASYSKEEKEKEEMVQHHPVLVKEKQEKTFSGSLFK